MDKDTKIIPATIERDGEIYVHVSDILTEKEINGKLQQELDKYKNIVDELEKWLNETQINSQFIDEETIMEVRSKLKELKGSDR